MKKQLLVIFALMMTFSAFSQTLDREEFVKNIRKGNKAYEKGNYEEADVSYRKAIDANPASFDAIYNLANTEYKQDKFEDAGKRYSSIISSTEDKEKKAHAYHNLGNTLLSEKKYKESIDAYKNALKLRPDDMETKSNLAYAQKKLEDEQGDGGGGGDNNQDQDQQNQNQNQEQNQDNENNQDQQNQNQNQDQNSQDSQQGQQPKISPQEAQQLLEAIQADEKETQEKVNKEKARAVGRQNIEKNW
jgi:tetratricopeptide (TPR) repeat protein